MMKPHIVLLITGMPASGKSIVSKILEEIGIHVIKMGDVLREEAIRRNIDLKNLGEFSLEIRKRFGKDIVARLTYEKILKMKQMPNVIAIEGLRSLDEYNFLKERFKNTVLIAIHSSPKTRFKRIIDRNREDDPKTFEEFVKRDLRELSYGVGNLIALADYIIVNEGTIEELKKSVIEFIKNLLKSHL